MKITQKRKITLDDGSKHECNVTISYDNVSEKSVHESAFCSDWIRYQVQLRKLTGKDVAQMIQDGGGLHVHASQVNNSIVSPEQLKTAMLDTAKSMTPEARALYIKDLQSMEVI